ncbi:hypothetical protein M569_12311 [Genlisea aurea]|uniref:SMP domain-containing protein n=1 Tax=Genlisea aurea TaxID=192259 RepID=S8C6T4_9LAMI|nr:hypothetical protein M569_12311 [Genlisea aurea]
MAGILLVTAFLLGALTVVAVELVMLGILIRRLSRKLERHDDTPPADSETDLTSSSAVDKQGFIWLLEPEKLLKSALQDKTTSERRKRKDIIEVTPVRKYARVKDHSLILLESDGSSVKFSLSGCTVVAVSSSSLSSRKWAKRYPIKVESNNSAVYKGSKIIYIYLETTWEKEAWCKALRLASFEDKEKIFWYSKLTREFKCYLDLLNTGYPSVVRPSSDLNSESKDVPAKLDNASSKIRQFLKKLSKKAPKNENDNKGSSVPENVSRKMDPKGKYPSIASSIDSGPATSVLIEQPEIKNLSGSTNVDSNIKCSDEGALCLNMLISRLFFDAKNNIQIMAFIKNRIQAEDYTSLFL